MRTTRAAIDPLWQCLCPAWTQTSVRRVSSRCLNPARTKPGIPTTKSAAFSTTARSRSEARLAASDLHHGVVYRPFPQEGSQYLKSKLETIPAQPLDHESTSDLYGYLKSAAAKGNVRECRRLAEYLVGTRRERPNLQLYNALILSNVDHEHGAAWRVSELLDEMQADGLQMDVGICHAVLKVVAVHVDHLLRTDVLDYMQKRWYQLSEDGAHDVAAGLLREGLFEQALQQLDKMRQGNGRVDIWLWDMAVYALCDAGEIEEAFRIVRTRYDSGNSIISRSIWFYLLDKGSEARHHEATSLVWTSQVNRGYINPSSGICLNILTTAARAGDAAMATEVFSHLSKRGTAFQPIHYELLISTYLSADPPDLKRALSILTIMPLEKLEPSLAETRSLYAYLRHQPGLVKEAFTVLRELHEQDRKIPIAALNLLIECHVEQRNFPEAMRVYKLIHTFAPISQGAQKSYANIETFNLLFKGCRLSNPPEEQQASFLVSELLALRITPTALTYDRLILVFIEAAKAAFSHAASLDDDSPAEKGLSKGKKLLDWAFRHFADMQPLGWVPRFGTMELLAVQLARIGDARCWDCLQIAEDHRDSIEGFEQKGKWAKKNVEDAWAHYANGEAPIVGAGQTETEAPAEAVASG